MSRARWVAGSLRGIFSRMRARLVLRKRLTRKSLVCWGTDIWRRPEGATEKRTLLESGFLRTITSPNSESCRSMRRLPSLELGQDLFELGGVGVFAREDDGILELRRSFEGLDAGFVDGFGFFDGFETGFEAGLDGGDIGLEPDESGGVASGAEDFVQLAAVALGGVAAFEHEGGTGLGDLADEQKHERTREAVFALQRVEIIKSGVELVRELLGECGFAAAGGAKNKNSARARDVAAVFLLTFHRLPPL